YKTIAAESKGLFRDRGSRFIAIAKPVTSQEDIKTILEDLRREYHDARHHCFAWMLTPDRQVWRVSDDGEPSGTAGRPIMGQINSHGLTNILVVVIRYFGGTLLGVSGLINAYRSAAEDALANARIIEKHVTESWLVTFPYTSMNDVMKVLKDEGCGQHAHDYTGEKCSAEISFRASKAEIVTGRLQKIAGLTLSWLRTE
ncbi:MAG TPA: YigZ family protein, partial [Bacteroidales bacterium]|nr:YigZ family protein [Bacteroidales bacterium]